MAREEEDEEAERQILGIIKREQEQAFWRRLKYTMKKQTGGSVQLVQVEDEDGNIEEFTTQEEVHEAMWSNIHQKGFYLAEEAPCTPAVYEGALVTTQTPKLPGPFWQATMSTLQTLTKQQERSLRSAPGSGL